MMSTTTIEMALGLLLQVNISVARDDFAEQAAIAARAKSELIAELQERKAAEEQAEGVTDDSTGEHSG
jgi:hypothetical protein